MKYFYFLIIALTVAVSGQSFALDALEQRVSSEAVKSHPACPSQDFPEFLKVFSESVGIQKAFTKYPLKYAQVTDATAEPLPKRSMRHLKKSDIRFPVFSSTKQLNIYGLRIDIQGKRQEKTEIVVERSAGEKSLGHYVEYKFIKNNQCWKLFEINDQST